MRKWGVTHAQWNEKYVQKFAGMAWEISRRSWKNYVKMVLKEIQYNEVDKIHLAKDEVHFRAFVRTISLLGLCWSDQGELWRTSHLHGVSFPNKLLCVASHVHKVFWTRGVSCVGKPVHRRSALARSIFISVSWCYGSFLSHAQVA